MQNMKCIKGSEKRIKNIFIPVESNQFCDIGLSPHKDLNLAFSLWDQAELMICQVFLQNITKASHKNAMEGTNSETLQGFAELFKLEFFTGKLQCRDCHLRYF